MGNEETEHSFKLYHQNLIEKCQRVNRGILIYRQILNIKMK
jgi:hypothetical protein